MEDRALLAVLPTNNVMDLTGLAISAAQNAQTTQDVATFTDTDSAAVPADFTATIAWPGGSTSAGVITEDASNVFHVMGTHAFGTAGAGQAITVTIKDSNGTLYQTGALNQTNIVSSVPSLAGETDSNLINPWGMSSSATSPIWVSDYGTGVATLYNPNGSPVTQPLTVTIEGGSPTGQVYNTDTSPTDFTIPGPSGPVPSIFLFATLGGEIDGWNPGSNGGTATALTAATTAGAEYTGLAQASVTSGLVTTSYLYAADSTGTTGANGIDVFDPTFTNVSGTTFAGKFVDPNAIVGDHAYNIALLSGDLYVTYAPSSGAGGYIDEFDTAGNFIDRIYTDVAGTNLTQPYGLTIAPAGFGSFGGDLLVGNFGDGSATAPNGTISAIALPTTPDTPGTLAGTLSTPNGTISTGGISTLLFGNGGSGGTAGTLYFNAGINDQADGLFGSIAFASAASASIAAAPLVAQGATVSGIEGNPLPVSPATDVLVATFMDSGTPGLPVSYLATINWGDNTPATAPTRITSQGTANGVVFSVYGTHTYDAPGTYATTVTITNTTDGAITIASGQAVIADAPLTASPTQPMVVETERVALSTLVAAFSDGDPLATEADYTDVTIYWGDGTPATAGTIVRFSSLPVFDVVGMHTYADSGVNGGVGDFKITVNVHDIDGASLTITNTAQVFDVPLTLTGKLNPSSDSGVSNSDNITSDVQPNFLGTTSEPDAKVTLYAQASGGTPVVIGQGVSNANDAWSITANQALATGTYAITAVAVDAAGFTTSATTTIVPDLVIDAVPPIITAATFDRFTDTLTVTYQDDLSGLALASITNGAFYHLSAQPLSPKVPVPKMLLPTAINYTPGATATDPVVVNVVFNHGHTVRGGRYLIVIDSGAGDSGVHDVAGNALDGNFYGTFPSGDGLAGGAFAAAIDTFHNDIVLPPVPFRDGYVPPRAATDPPAHAKTGKNEQTKHQPTAKAKVVRQPAKNAETHTRSLMMVAFGAKGGRKSV